MFFIQFFSPYLIILFLYNLEINLNYILNRVIFMITVNLILPEFFFLILNPNKLLTPNHYQIQIQFFSVFYHKSF